MFTTLTRKLVLIIGLMFGLMAIVGPYNFYTVQQIQNSVDALTHKTVVKILASEAYARDIRRGIAEGQAYARGGETDDLVEAQAVLDDAARQLETIRGHSELAPRSPALAAATMATFAERQEFLATTQASLTRLVAAVEADDPAAVATGIAALEAADDGFTELENQVAGTLQQDVEVDLGTAIQPIATIRWGLIIGTVVVGLLLLGSLLLLYRVIERPLAQLSAAALPMAQGGDLVDVDVTRRDELGVLQQALNALLATIREKTADLVDQVRVAQHARQQAEQAGALVQTQLAMIASPQQVIRDMSVPVLPLSASTLVMPLVGALDSGRLAQMQDQALAAVEHAQASALVIDVTGVPFIDS